MQVERFGKNHSMTQCTLDELQVLKSDVEAMQYERRLERVRSEALSEKTMRQQMLITCSESLAKFKCKPDISAMADKTMRQQISSVCCVQ